MQGKEWTPGSAPALHAARPKNENKKGAGAEKDVHTNNTSIRTGPGTSSSIYSVHHRVMLFYVVPEEPCLMRTTLRKKNGQGILNDGHWNAVGPVGGGDW